MQTMVYCSAVMEEIDACCGTAGQRDIIPLNVGCLASTGSQKSNERHSACVACSHTL